ncbi:MAG: hypothetical protein M3164_03920, partial [Actinomycetota bacterium]|nr:hypothetical protein [Actinomycetota bacterium]
HAERYPDFGTVWYWLAKYGRKAYPASFWEPGQPGYRDFVSLASLVLFALGSAAILLHGWGRRREPEGYPVAAAGLGILCLFLLTSKVHSPQYALWVAPLLAWLAIPWPLVIAYLAADVGVFVSGFYYFTVMDEPSPGWYGAFEAAVWVRAAALAGLLWASLRAARTTPAGLPARPAPPGAVEISSQPA